MIFGEECSASPSLYPDLDFKITSSPLIVVEICVNNVAARLNASITSGGIIGIVERVMEDDRIEVLIGESTKVQIIRSTITSLLKKEEIKK